MKIKSTARNRFGFGTALISLILLSGCSSVFVTYNYKQRIKMSEDEAINQIKDKHSKISWQPIAIPQEAGGDYSVNLNVDQVYLACNWRETIEYKVSETKEMPTPPRYDTIINIKREYINIPMESLKTIIKFSDVKKIYLSWDGIKSKIYLISDYKIYLISDYKKGWDLCIEAYFYNTNTIISALLTLCHELDQEPPG